jgi:hypothetical protein
MHRFPDDGPFERAMQVNELDYIASSRANQHCGKLRRAACLMEALEGHRQSQCTR